MVSGTSQARPGCPEFLSFLVVCFGARAAARGGFQSLELVRPLSISVGILQWVFLTIVAIMALIGRKKVRTK